VRRRYQPVPIDDDDDSSFALFAAGNDKCALPLGQPRTLHAQTSLMMRDE
jgi:hypothetical protein